MKGVLLKSILAIIIVGVASTIATADFLLQTNRTPVITQNPTPDQNNPTTKNLELLLIEFGYELAEANDQLLLPSVIGNDATVQTKTILFQNDRIGTIAWTQHPQVRNYFLSLKEALFQNFSTGVQNLQDRSIRVPGEPEAYNELQFLDPSISTNQLTFGRKMDTLFELRIQPDKTDVIAPFLEAMRN